MRTLLIAGLCLILCGSRSWAQETSTQDGVSASKASSKSISRKLEAAGALRSHETDSERQALRRLRRWLASPNTGASPTDAERKLLDDPDAVRQQREQLKAWLTDPPNQRKLIASGALKAEVGNAALDKLRAAVVNFRVATGSQIVGMLSQDEISQLDASEKEIDAFARFEERMNAKAKMPVYLPLGLVREQHDADPDDPNDSDGSWTTYSSADNKIRVDQINYTLRAETPVSLATLLMERRKDVQFDALELAGDSFKIEASALNKDRTGREYVAFGAREIKGKVQGYGLRVALEPPAGLSVPTILVVDKSEQASAAASGSTVTPEENWRAVIRILRNLIASRHNETDSYKPISRQSCAGVETSEMGAVKTVRILYATDRQPTFKTPVAEPYDLSAMFSSELDSTRLHLGCLEVQVRSPGSSEAVGAYGSGIKSLFEQRIQDKPVKAVKFTPFEPPIDFSQPKRLVFRSDEVSGYERALLYIHGYNNGFEDAVRHVANIAASSDYYGQIYMFSWPSTQRVLNYAPDMDLAEQSEVHLSAFLKAIASSGDLVGLDIVAHSMGSQILLRTLDGLRPMLDRRLSKDGRYDRFRLGQIVFAAPDVSSIVFAQKVQPFTYFADRITVYASGNDGVLALSSLLRGNVPRAGYIQNGTPMRSNGVDVIDITREPEHRYMFGNMCGSYHAAFINDASVLEDIVHILKQGQSGRSAVRRATPERRTALAGTKGKFNEKPYPTDPIEGDGRYWSLAPLYGKSKPEEKFVDPSLDRLKEDLCTNL
ncbi:MAG: alpha/beta hydrolase [Hyphomicrobiaceae bacterium]